MSNGPSGFLGTRSDFDTKSFSAPALDGGGLPAVASWWLIIFGLSSRDCHDGWTVFGG